jgi:hypothetical protein
MKQRAKSLRLPHQEAGRQPILRKPGDGSAVVLLEPSQESVRQMLRWILQFNLGRKRILDTHLAAVLHIAGVRRLLTSNSADFTVFGVLETVVP